MSDYSKPATEWSDADWKDLVANPQPPDDPDAENEVQEWIYFENGKPISFTRRSSSRPAYLTVTVPPELAEFADDYGRRLFEFRRHNTHKNNLEHDPVRDLWQNILGARGEAGFYFFLGGKRRGAAWDVSITNDRDFGNTPDIIYEELEYDAKAIDQSHKGLCVYEGGVHPGWRYVLVGTWAWPRAEMLGWCPGSDILTVPLEEKVKDRPAHFIAQGDPLLRSCSELREPPEMPF